MLGRTWRCDDVVIHRHVLLDDRGGIRLGNRVSVADYANIYGHTPALHDGRDVETPAVISGSRVRITYHATVLGEVTWPMTGCLAPSPWPRLTSPSGPVALGIAAQPKLAKPPVSERPSLPRTRDPLADQ